MPEIVISLSPRALPLYAFYSVVRIGLAYLLSLVFAIGYGYVAAYNKRVEALMIAGLDILQSIPVLSFLPGVMLAMVALFPTRQIGVEMGAIVLIFTGQVWNMAFSFYSSIKSIPRELARGCEHLSLFALAAAGAAGASLFGDWAGVELDGVGGGRMVLPDGVRDVCSRARATSGCRGWVRICRRRRARETATAITWGLLTMIAIIVATDQLIWRPVIAWSDKFKFEQVESASRVRSPLLHLLQHSRALRTLRQHTIAPLGEGVYRRLAKARRRSVQRRLASESETRVRHDAAAALVCGD